jgi:dTDP-4-amino-4,6-dideoxy-D-galactose acyltransferase
MASIRTRPVNLVEDWKALERLLASRPKQLCACCRNRIEPGRLLQLTLQRARPCIAAESSSIAVQPGGDICGLACWTRLDWDSAQFGFPAARIEFLLADGGYDSELDRKRILLARVLEQVRESGIRHLTARVDAADLASVHALEQCGFETIDAIQTFSLHLDAPRNGVPANFETRLFRDEDLAQVIEIAKSSYVHDRFHADSAIGPAAADRINEEWLRNSCSLQAADAVVVAVEASTVLGYVTCKIDHETTQALGFCFASIVMVATRQQARGRGVAQACTSAALDWFRANDVDVVEVGTQLSNIPAARLYEKNGFRMAASSFTLRKIFGAGH